MKKIGSVVLVFLLCLSFVACGRAREALTAQQFENHMVENGFEVLETEGRAHVSSAEDTLVADNGNYQVEFYTFASAADATSMFKENKAIFESHKGNGSVENSVSMNNYAYYSLTAQGVYYYICRIDSTCLVLSTSDGYKDEIKEMTKNLGY